MLSQETLDELTAYYKSVVSHCDKKYIYLMWFSNKFVIVVI